MKYARTHKTWGYCARSGRRMLLKDMVRDGYDEGLLVDPKYYDPPHPQEKLKPIDDPVSVYRPAPDLDKPAFKFMFPVYDLANDAVYGSLLGKNYIGNATLVKV